MAFHGMKTGLTRIITKLYSSRRVHHGGKSKGGKQSRYAADWWYIGIATAAYLVRVYRISELTEFLGDQGRTMLVMRSFLSGMVPFAGPTTLSGHHLGPVFYYLLLPGYMVFQTPLGISVWMCVLGSFAALLLYDTIKRTSGMWPARMMSLLWISSAHLISSDRVIWEPNLVPLFSLLFINSLVRAHRTDKMVWWVGVGASLGILVQLHYPNLYFGVLLLIYMGARYFSGIPLRSLIYKMAWIALAFVAMLFPFLLYEVSVGFTDLIGVFQFVMRGTPSPISKRLFIRLFGDYAHRVFGRMVPGLTPETGLMATGVAFLFVLFSRSRYRMFLAAWLFGGLVAMMRYRGVVHDHYLFFLIPAAFLLVADSIRFVQSLPVRRSVAVVVIMFSFWQIVKADVWTQGRFDIARTQKSVAYMSRQATGNPFSFTLIESPSFSDLEYRYYFDETGTIPDPIDSMSYKKLFIVCERDECPSPQVIARTGVRALCYEHHCQGDYPFVNIENDWMFEQLSTIPCADGACARVYTYTRK